MSKIKESTDQVEKMKDILKEMAPPKGRILHVSLPPVLSERVDRVLAMTDYETYSQMARVGLKRLCDEILGRADKIREMEEVDKGPRIPL